MVALVVYLYPVSVGLLAYPVYIFVDIACVDNEEEVVVSILVYQKVIYRAAIGIEHHAVGNFAGRERADIVGENVVDEFFGVGSGYLHFAHVGNVENAYMVAHGIVFADDVLVLDGHIKAAEGADKRSKADMLLIKAGSFVLGHSCMNLLKQ